MGDPRYPRLSLAEAFGSTATLVESVKALAGDCSALLRKHDEQIGTGHQYTPGEAKYLEDIMRTYAHQLFDAAFAVRIVTSALCFSAGTVPADMTEKETEGEDEEPRM